MSNTRDSVSFGYPDKKKAVNTTRSRGVWIADEALSRVTDISSQSKQKLSKFMLFKTGLRYPNLLHVNFVICFCFNVVSVCKSN